MRKAALVTCLLAAFALSACTTTEAGEPVTSGAAAPAGSGASSVFTDTNGLAGALKTQSGIKKTAHFTFSVSTPQGDMGGQGEMRMGTDFAMNITMTVPGAGDITMIVLPDGAYMKLPQSLGVQPGKPWIKISTDGSDGLSKSYGVIIKSIQDNSDITKSIEKLQDAGSITRSAKEQLDGAAVTHYWITVDLAKSVAAQTDPTVKDATQKLIDSGVKTSSFEIWVNKDNLPVKFVAQMPTPAGGTPSFTETFSDWGKAVNITAPPADQIMQMPKLGG
jgi:predicted small secreted protein